MARLILVCVALVTFLPYSASTDTITSTTPLRDGDVLVSSGGTYAMGFFNPDGSANRYVGIWYNRIPIRTVVWVANRDDPISNESGVASILPSGDLGIHHGNEKAPVWSTTVPATAAGTSNTLAQLNDSGNLILFPSQNRDIILWQSFDYPSNTFISFMKLGVNRRTGFKWFLTSWKSPADPGTGDCTLEMSAEGLPQLLFRKGSTKLWRSGPWIGDRFGGVPVSSYTKTMSLTYIDNQDEVSVVFDSYNASVISNTLVNNSGSVERRLWFSNESTKWVQMWVSTKDECDGYGECGPNGYCDPYDRNRVFDCKCLPGFEPALPGAWSMRDGSGGCVRKKGSGGVCGNGEGFVKVERTKVADTTVGRLDHGLDGYGGCEQLCLKNCSCSAYAFANVSGRGDGCVTWYGNLTDIKLYSNGGIDMYIRVDAVEFAKYAERSKKFQWKWLLAITGPLIVGLCVLSLAYRCVWKKNKGENEETDNQPILIDGPHKNEIDKDLQLFDLRTIVSATNDFSIENKLGEGGFGTVYKGYLDDGQEIAIKRLSKSSGQGTTEFKNEVTLIAKLQHKNLVKLLGCCIDKEEKILIYEYLPNKSLDYFIFDKEKGLKWRKRFEIILGIVRGIIYLHEDSRLKIIHRDLKASNVLLDVDMNPKISDFGMARIFREDQLQANTQRVVGTYGYMSPEYAMEGLFSIKSDVFSFGVLMIEIISGRKNSSFFQKNSTNLTGHVWKLWNEEKANDLVDESLGKSYDHRQVLRCIHVALLCLQELAIHRPTMSEVSFMLSHDVANLPCPNPPAFIIKKENFCLQCSSSSASACVHSVNGITLTEIDAR